MRNTMEKHEGILQEKILSDTMRNQEAFMKKQVLLAVIVVMIQGLPVYPTEAKMVTTDDLEREYPAEDTSVEETWQMQNERLQRQYECEALKQSVAEARRAVHDENEDRSTYADRAELYYRIKTEYANKCGSQ